MKRLSTEFPHTLIMTAFVFNCVGAIADWKVCFMVSAAFCLLALAAMVELTWRSLRATEKITRRSLWETIYYWIFLLAIIASNILNFLP